MRGGKATPGRSGGRQARVEPLHRGAGIPDGSVPRAHWPCRPQTSSVVLTWGGGPMASRGYQSGMRCSGQRPGHKELPGCGVSRAVGSPGPRPRRPWKVLGWGGAGQKDCVSGGPCSSALSWAGKQGRRRLVTECPPIPVAPMRAGRGADPRSPILTLPGATAPTPPSGLK